MRMRAHIWYSILPSEGRNDDISSGSRQRWEHLLPIIIHLGLIEKNEKASNGFEVVTSKWAEFVRLLPGDQKLHFATTQRKNEARQFYICLARPQYTNPIKQLKAVASKKFAFEELVYMDQGDKNLRNMILLHINMLDANGSIHATTSPPATSTVSPPLTSSPVPVAPPESTEPPEQITAPAPSPSPTPAPSNTPTAPKPIPPPTPTPCIVLLPSPFEAEVNYAHALDFNTTPRLHRHGDDEILVHKKK